MCVSRVCVGEVDDGWAVVDEDRKTERGGYQVLDEMVIEDNTNTRARSSNPCPRGQSHLTNSFSSGLSSAPWAGEVVGMVNV